MSPIIGAHQRTGQELLDRQCWNWGRDIVRPDGNLLLEAGFLKGRPPEGKAGSNCYTLALPDGDSLMLWGFGLLYGTPQKGGVYLNRFEFRPVWLPSETIPGPIWKPDMIPAARTPPSPRLPVDLTVAAIRRIADYEEWGALALRSGVSSRRPARMETALRATAAADASPGLAHACRRNRILSPCRNRIERSTPSRPLEIGATIPPFDPISPLLQSGRPGHVPTARGADRAVAVRVIRGRSAAKLSSDIRNVQAPLSFAREHRPPPSDRVRNAD